ncbi:MAG: hypothetical protein IKY67_04275 [Paludibacteraceae bacterium]|nr:hypothetical protein [Paludibacteraceae bacterium]
MKRNIDFYIMLFICVLVCGVLYVLCDHTGEYSAPKSGNVFALRGTEYSANSHGSAANANSWTSVGGSVQTTATSRVRVSAPSSARSRGQIQGSSSYLPMISSPATNSAGRVGHSAIGGNAKGAATVSGFAKNMPSQSVAYRGFSQSLAYGGRTNAMSSNAHRSLLESSPTSYVSANVGGDAVCQSVRQASTPSLVGASSYTSVYAHNSRGLSVYGNNSTIGEAMTSPYRASAQHRAPSSGLGNSWLNWLDDTYGGYFGEEGGTKTFTYDEIYAAWEELCSSWNTGMGAPPTWDDFLEWFLSGGETGHNKGNKYYKYVPIGDVLPLVWMALAYMAVMFIRKRKELIK